MSNRGRIALWTFVIMILSFSFAFTSFVRTGILQVNTSDGLGYQLNMNLQDDPFLDSPLLVDSQSSSNPAKQLMIKTEFDHIRIIPSADNAFHFSLYTHSDSDRPKLDITERGDYLSVTLSHEKPFAFNTPSGSLEIQIPDHTLKIMKVSSTSGNIHIDDTLKNIFETCQFQSQSGNISLTPVAVEHLKVESQSGNISIDLISEESTDVSASTDSGHIINHWQSDKVDGPNDKVLHVDMADNQIFVDLKTTSGNIAIYPH